MRENERSCCDEMVQSHLLFSVSRTEANGGGDTARGSETQKSMAPERLPEMGFAVPSVARRWGMSRCFLFPIIKCKKRLYVEIVRTQQ